jgi:hypothetical protein
MAEETGFNLFEGSVVTGEGITSFDFTDPNLQVPAPPVKETVKELKQLLSDQKTTLDAMRGGFVSGKSYNGIKPRNVNDFDAIRNGLVQIVKTDLPEQITAREEWDNSYRVKSIKPMARDKVLYTAAEIYEIQDYHRKAGNYNDPEIKAYANAVKAVETLQAKFEDSKSKESNLSKAEQQLALAGAWRIVESTITPKIKELRSKNYPLGVNFWGKTISRTDFQLASTVPAKVTSLVNSAIKEKDRETSRIEVVSTDKYGAVTRQERVRDEQKSKEFRLFQDRANQIVGSKPELARGIVNETVSTPVLAGASITSAESTKRGQTAESARLEAMAKQFAPPVDVQEASNKPVVPGAPGSNKPGVPGPGGTIGGGTTDTAKFKVGDWQAVLQDQFPGYSKDWLAANSAQHFGQDMINLMTEAAKPNGKYLGLTTEASVTAFKKALKQTVYWQTTETTAKSFDQAIGVDRDRLINNKKLEIANSYGDVSFDDATLTQLATSAARLGLTGLGLQQAVYSGALKPGAGGAQTALAGRVLEGADADRIRSIGRGWNTKITDGQIQSILTGKADPATGLVLTEDALREQLQAKWKGAMPHLSDQFDSGLTLDQIGSSYRTYAAQLLEKPEDQINMFEGPYLQAFDNNAGGQLSLSQWIEKIKTDDRFGWQYTKQANQQATDVALTLARAFGKVA